MRYDIATTKGLMAITNPFGSKTFNPEVYLFLADRYGRLAVHYDRLGKEA